jgi:UDP-N-acetylmuramyl pentapeptide phosphotransferase/UDP-N-acetylglucosamine-1-phosphate transferase
LAILLGLLFGQRYAPPEVAALLVTLLIASLPAFLFGFAEDLTKRVGVRERLLATMASGVLACWLTGVSLNRLDVWGVDALLGSWPILAIAFTAFALAGVANAVNIIDGFNGLAAGVVIVCLAALGSCAYMVGDTTLAKTCIVIGCVIAGFAALNFPFGKIFLGDGGAYLIGFWLGWMAVLLPMRNPTVSPWFSLLACGYPILEVLFSVVRRYRRHAHPGHPDRLHLHSLVKTRVIRKRLLALPPVLRNSAVSPIVWGFAMGPAILAVVLHSMPVALIVSFLVSAIAYAIFYRRLVRFGWFR